MSPTVSNLVHIDFGQWVDDFDEEIQLLKVSKTPESKHTENSLKPREQ
jgi:hypothetical protein